jgi:thioredoxin 1
MSQFIHIDENNFEQEVLLSNAPVLLEFGADWCTPCKRLEPLLTELGNTWGNRVRLAKVNVDQCANLTMQFQVMSVPTVILFKNGQPVETTTGLQTRQKLIEKFEPHL